MEEFENHLKEVLAMKDPRCWRCYVKFYFASSVINVKNTTIDEPKESGEDQEQRKQMSQSEPVPKQ